MGYFLDFELPRDLIAAEPSERRGDDRIMLLQSGEIFHLNFPEALSLIREGDLIVFNNSRVFKARLFFVSAKSGLESELLLVEQQTPVLWTALIKKARRLNEGDEIFIQNRRARVGRTLDEGLRELSFDGPFSAEDAEQLGQIPLPPYIIEERRRRSLPLYTEKDEERYQTVFARLYGSVAAPTASLRFTPEILAGLNARGVHTAEATLHVGLGTFKPMGCAPEDFKIHSERAEIPLETAEAIAKTKAAGGRVIASGTTVCRTLEAFQGRAFSGNAEIFIKPGWRFHTVDGLLTNFHLPHSTLLLLVQALAGAEPIRRAYAEAVQKKYRFFSYGDGMLILP